MEVNNMDNKWITATFFGVSLLVLLILENRALFIGAISSYIIIKRPRYTAFWLLSIILCAIGISVFMKTDSSLGRLLVYKISTSIFRDNWLYGCGLGQFGQVYLIEQAKYFSQPGFDIKELLLADNTVYAFNDWYQLVCETGLLGILSILLFCYAIYRLDTFFENRQFFWKKVFFLTILISALFTHLFEKQYILLFMAIIFFSMILKKCDSTQNIILLKLVFKIILFWFGVNGFHSIYIESRLKESIQLSNSGQFYRSNILLDELRRDGNCSSDCVFFYSRNCARLGRTDEAIQALEKLALRETNSLYHSLLADLYSARNDYVMAEKNLLLAINMVPNRFEERYKLLELYQKKHDSINSIKVASSIIELPVKVNSDRIQFIKQYSNQILNTY
ncbi:hypothetical protein [uncultured Sphingobacterium sp.]|uniref:hypothetical protein n=1 Tax=uncultured Sphingobacterium sp. TaxID=182688 RepID=UPI0025FA8409|nr:hypothetical protein [uncultured Sphingobacterium sp.]